MEYLPNRLTLLYSEIYYKEENYLKVKTAVFKYITPPYSKDWVRSASVYQYIGCSEYIMFLHSKLMYILSFNYITQLPLVLWFYWFH